MSSIAEHWKFRPHRLLRNAHLQTVAAIYLPRKYAPYKAVQHFVAVDDVSPEQGGDQIALHEDQPSVREPTSPAVLLIHGLSGCYQSTYMCRMADHLSARGCTVFRMDMRGCGAGRFVARNPTHCGRSGDVVAALEFIAQRYPSAPVMAIGYSMGGTLLLNMLAEAGRARIGNLTRSLVICPPIDLFAVQRQFDTRLGRRYDRFFVRSLWQQITARWQHFPDAAPRTPQRSPQRLNDIDEWVIAPSGGFDSADHYYSSTQPGPKLAAIRQPTLIIASKDDPIVPTAPLLEYPRSESVKAVIMPAGGHLGFIAAPNGDPDVRWLDWRILDWLEHGGD